MPVIHVLIMAGGMGKRMKSPLPKVLHHFRNQPMLVHLLQKVNSFFHTLKFLSKTQSLQSGKIMIVINPIHATQIQETIQQFLPNTSQQIYYLIQEIPLGTGHAVLTAQDILQDSLDDHILVLNGDNPLLSILTLQEITMQQLSQKAMVTFMIAEMKNPTGSGRVITVFDPHTHNESLLGIIEENDCTEEQKQIKRINAGLYIFRVDSLFAQLSNVKNKNKQGEYYLPDVLLLIQNDESFRDTNYAPLSLYLLPQDRIAEKSNINTKEQLEEIERLSHSRDSNSFLSKTIRDKH